jgi:UDP-2-acetamido-3-amino-2,3-dideoxy-glucuronate N-acetyltransferase
MNFTAHPLADVLSSDIGDGTVIWQFVVVLKKAQIGRDCNINCNCFIENDVILGDKVTIKSGVQLWDGIRIEDNVFVGPNVTFTNDIVPRSKRYPARFEQTAIKEGASIGANATIIAGIVIGEYSFVGAGSVVTKDIPAFTMWYGNPARHKGYITRDGILLNLSLFDNKEKQQYVLQEGEPIKQAANPDT